MFDHLCSYPDKIQCAEGSPLTEIDSLYFKWCEAASNINIVQNPTKYPRLPDLWYDWARAMTPRELKEFPLIAQHELDLEHVATNPVAMQPGKTAGVNKFKTYVISPRKVVTMLVNWGRDYPLCKRFNGEHIVYVTQHVEEGAMSEPDPVKRLGMFSVEVEVRARLHIMKSLWPLTTIANQ